MKNISSPRGIAFTAAILFSALSAHAQSWDFSTDAQGWKINDLNGSGVYTSTGSITNPTHSSTGGNPGGFISSSDPSNFSFFFQSPTSLGDFSSYFGGTLNFSLRTDLTPDWATDSVVVLKGIDNTLLVAGFGYQPGSNWTTYSLSLIPQNFHFNSLGGALATSSDLSSLLGNLDSVLINGEFHNGVVETSGLSAVNFQAASPVTPVPEPSTYGLLGAGALAGLAALRRRRKA